MNAQAQAQERAARADARLQTAHELLRALDLIQRWSAYGEVTVVGSVGIELVVAPDIDLEIRSEEPRVADGFAVMSVLAELPQVRRITYLDARDRHEQGQYWKLEYETPDDTWTVDMWVFGPEALGGGPLTAALQQLLTPGQPRHDPRDQRGGRDPRRACIRLLAVPGGPRRRRHVVRRIPRLAGRPQRLRTHRLAH